MWISHLGRATSCRSPGPAPGIHGHEACGGPRNLHFSRTPVDDDVEGGFLELNQAYEKTEQGVFEFQLTRIKHLSTSKSGLQNSAS